MLYCPSCRDDFVGHSPPYSAVHTMTDPPVHLHPETRAVLVSLDDLTDSWHAGEFPGVSLEAVIRDYTGWDERQYGQWVTSGTVA